MCTLVCMCVWLCVSSQGLCVRVCACHESGSSFFCSSLFKHCSPAVDKPLVFFRYFGVHRDENLCPDSIRQEINGGFHFLLSPQRHDNDRSLRKGG